MSAGKERAGALAVVARLSLWIAGLGLVAMTLVEFWQVFARYVLNDSPSWTEPVALFAMKCAMMFGAAAGVATDSHFSFQMFVQVAPRRLGRLLVAFARFVVFATGAVLAVWGGILTIDGWGVPMAGAPLPEGLAYLPVAAGGALIALFSAGNLGRRDSGAES